MNGKTELKIIIDHQGIRCVQITGAPDTHMAGHELYLKIVDLVQDFDKTIQKRISEENDERSGHYVLQNPNTDIK